MIGEFCCAVKTNTEIFTEGSIFLRVGESKNECTLDYFETDPISAPSFIIQRRGHEDIYFFLHERKNKHRYVEVDASGVHNNVGISIRFKPPALKLYVLEFMYRHYYFSNITLKPLFWQRGVFKGLQDFCIALSFFVLPPYILLEIFDWLPFMFGIDHRKKIDSIQRFCASMQKFHFFHTS